MPTVTFPPFDPVDVWSLKYDTTKWRTDFQDNGFLVVRDILDAQCLDVYRNVYAKLLSGEVDAKNHRHDLGSHAEKKRNGIENICQIMWPSVYFPGIEKGPLHERTLKIAQCILGDDMAFDFDMLIAKLARTSTKTPWHQDQAYWPDMPDKRAVSFWTAMDDATVNNGCMWFIKDSHKLPTRKHIRVEGEHVLKCEDASEAEGKPEPIPAGSCTAHHGATLHYTRGNTTNQDRRAYIVNFRPASMVQWERDNNFDHAKGGIKAVLKPGTKGYGEV